MKPAAIDTARSVIVHCNYPWDNDNDNDNDNDKG